MNWERRPEELRENVKSLPGKKNTREWCRGKVGRRHDVRMRKRKPYDFNNQRAEDVTCRRWEFGLRTWHCYHQLYCVSCDKILRHTLGDDCPDRTPDPQVDVRTR